MKQEDKELLIRDLCSRLPYGVKAWDSQSLEGEEVISITQVDMHGDVVYLADEHGNFEIKLEDIKLCLLPLSALTKEITINGETFVPIERIVEMAIGKFYGMQKTDASCEEVRFNLLVNDEDYSFSIREKDLLISLWSHTHQEYHRDFSILKVIDYFHEFHIDYRGLIERGLAVSVYELDKNPYE